MARHAWIAGTLSVAKHVAVWALALGLHTALTSDASIPFAVVNGGLIGLMVGIAERAFLDGALRRRRRRPFMAVIAQRAAVYTTCWVTSAVVIVGTVLATSEWSLANLSGDDPRQEDFWAYYNSFRPTNISLQGALGVAFLLSFARQVNALLGKGVLLKYVLGKYHRPRTEERVFMFLDLNSATTIAEQLGPERYSEFLCDFFFDIGDEVARASGEIVQYVGDEVVITWTMAGAVRRSNCVAFFYAVAGRIQKSKPAYMAKFGVCPDFKAGVHSGQIVVAEVGKERREIAYHGDTMNTAARIRSACHDVGANLLVSDALLARLDLPADIHAQAVGPLRLSGRDEPVDVHSVSIGPAD